MDFNGTISTSGTSYVVAIPRQIITDLNLEPVTKETILYENDSILIPFKWKGLMTQSERILNERLDKITHYIFDFDPYLHPFTYDLMLFVLGLIRRVFVDGYGYDHFKTRMLKMMMKSIKKDSSSQYDYYYYDMIVVDEDEQFLGYRWEFVEEEEMQSTKYKEYLEVKKLRDKLPKTFKTYFEICAIFEYGTVITFKNEHISLNAVKDLLNIMESDEFNSFLYDLETREDIHKISRKQQTVV